MADKKYAAMFSAAISATSTSMNLWRIGRGAVSPMPVACDKRRPRRIMVAPASSSTPLTAATMRAAAQTQAVAVPASNGRAQIAHSAAKIAQTRIPMPRPRSADGGMAGAACSFMGVPCRSRDCVTSDAGKHHARPTVGTVSASK